ncbi:PEP-utilizing enzyme [Pantoea ananatis]
MTNRGGRTRHAAIIARELGIPAVVGCGDATERLKEGHTVTVSCAEGDTGYVYDELLDFDVTSSQVDTMPDLPLKIMMNVGNPDRAFDFALFAKRRGWSGAAGIYYQPHDRRASKSVAGVRSANP